MPQAPRREIRVPRKPLRLSVTTACEMLDLAPSAVRALFENGTFTCLAPHGRGRGKRLYLVPAEVEAYAVGGRDAVEKIRAALR